MKAYCEQKDRCRRQAFAEHFGPAAGGGAFKPCGNMCDNCLGIQHEPVRKKVAAKKRKAPAKVSLPFSSVAQPPKAKAPIVIEEPTCYGDDEIEYLEAGDNGEWKRVRCL
jgi:hypothetical protein